jgi:hypothetical protein
VRTPSEILSITTALCRILERLTSMVEMPSLPGISTSIRTMERSQELYQHQSPLRQEYRRMLWRSHSPSGGMSLPLTLLLEVSQKEIVGKRLVIGQKI